MSPTQASNPSIQLSLRVDNDSELPKLLEGRTVAVLGQPLQNLTAEANECGRKIKLHQQLVRARRLRAILEDAANRADALSDDSPSSYTAAIDILQSTIPQINELVKLTEALRGSYTLDDDSDYGEWNEWTRAMDRIDGEQFMRNQRILRQQLRELGKEFNKDLHLDTEIEEKHDEMISRRTERLVNIADEIDESSDEERERMHLSEWSKKKNTSEYIYDLAPSYKKRHALKESEPQMINHTDRQGDGISSDKTEYTKPTCSSQEIGRISLIKRIESERVNAMSSTLSSKPSTFKRALSPIQKSKELLASSDQEVERKRPPDNGKESVKKKSKMKERTARKNPPETSFPLSSCTYQTTKTAQFKSADGSSRPIKKCHDCKESTTRYRKCSYWQVTGNKCGKTFCIECLSSKYSLGDDVLGKDKPNGIPIDEIIRRATYDVEWHCPSCLKTCLCSVCHKQRERDEQRERSRDLGGRRSGRRMAEQSDYSNFFHLSGGMVSFP